MAKCEYCGKYYKDGTGIASRFRDSHYCSQKCYIRSGASKRDENTENYYQKDSLGKIIRGSVNFVIMGAVMYFVLSMCFNDMPSGLVLLISLACGTITAVVPKFRNRKLGLIFPAAAIAIRFLFG